MVNYGKAVIYFLCNHENNNVFIGATTASLAKVMAKHRKTARESNESIELYKAMRYIGINQFYIIKHKDVTANNKDDLNAVLYHTIQEYKNLAIYNHKTADYLP